MNRSLDIMSLDIKKNIEEVLEEISEAAVKAGRDPDSVHLMAVTKTKPSEYVDTAYSAGLRLFGENRVNELEDKFTVKRDGAQVHLIGHLQRNKAKKAVQFADSIDSVDKYETAKEINRHCSDLGKYMNILLEFNTSDEDSKSGFLNIDDFYETVDKIRELEFIRIKGLMTIAPFTDDEKAVSASFKKLSELYKGLDSRHPDLKIDTLSMGMSSDFRLAVKEGSTIIRIGTRLFGARNY